MAQIDKVDDHGLEVLKKAGYIPDDTKLTEYAIRTASSPTGLSNSPIITTVTLNAVAWTTITLDTTFNTVAIQNRNGFNTNSSAILVNGDTGATLTEGWYVAAGGELMFDLRGTVTIVAIAESGTPIITVMGIG